MRSTHEAKDARRNDRSPVEAPAFLPEGAFVVQFKTGTEAAANGLAGRVEHVVSGQAAHFESPDELLAFLRTVLQR